MNTNLSTKEIESLISLCWMASMADGQRSEPERAEIRRITETLTSAEIRHDLLYTDVVAGLKTLEDIVAALPDPKLRTQAFEMAACVCMSDQDFTKKERTFLNGLREALGLDLAVTEPIERNLKILVTPPAPVVPAVVPAPAPAVVAVVAPAPSAPKPAAPVSAPAAVAAPVPAPAAGPGFTPLRPYVVPMAAPAAKTAVADLDPLIRKNAILAGALEAKGDPMSSIGIAPLQRRVVARVSQLLGRELDRAKTMELLNAVGVSQAAVTPAAEASGGYLQKLFGNLIKKAPAAPEKHAFAQTYALGQFAKLYSTRGPGWSPAEMKQQFDTLLADAKPLQAQATAEIQQAAAGIDPNKVGELVAAV